MTPQGTPSAPGEATAGPDAAKVLDAVAALVLVLDRDGRITGLNAPARRFLKGGVAAGTPVMDLMPPPERPVVARLVERAWAGDTALTHEHVWRAGDGRCARIRWSYGLAALDDGKGRYIVATGVDVTAWRLEEAQARRRDEAGRIQRLQIANELSIQLANELNQPLGAITMFADVGRALLARRPLDHASLAVNLGQISMEAMRGGEIIRRLRDFVRQGRMGPGPVDLNAAVRGVCEGMTMVGLRTAPVRTDLAGDLPPVMAVALHLEQILSNLLRRAQSAGAGEARQRGAITVQTRRAGSGARVTVRDPGPPVPAGGEQEVLESPTDPNPGLLRVSLSISRSLAASMGGRLWAEHRPEGGVLHLDLPFAP